MSVNNTLKLYLSAEILEEYQQIYWRAVGTLFKYRLLCVFTSLLSAPSQHSSDRQANKTWHVLSSIMDAAYGAIKPGAAVYSFHPGGQLKDTFG